MKNSKLYRTRQQVVGGVCGGIAKYLNVDVSLVRLITLIAILFGGVSFWLYVIAWVIIPVEPRYVSSGFARDTSDVVVVEDEPSSRKVKVEPKRQPEDNGPEW